MNIHLRQLLLRKVKDLNSVKMISQLQTKETKVVVLPHNFNNKLSNLYFIHLYKMTGRPDIKDAELGKNIIEWHVEGSDIKVRTESYDYWKILAKDLSGFYTYLSHGMNRNEFLKYMNLEPNDVVGIISYVTVNY